MVKINHNEEFGGVELYFEDKPEAEVIECLKENGYRWHRSKKCWYIKAGKFDDDVLEGCGIHEFSEMAAGEAPLGMDQIIEEACQASITAAEARLYELEGGPDAWSVIDNAPSDGVFYNPEKPTREVGRMKDLCGFADVRMKAKGKAREFVKFVKYRGKETSNNWWDYGSMQLSKSYDVGFYIWPPLGEASSTQYISVKEAGCKAFSGVLNRHGIECRTESRLD
tara:strand:- start:1988 stop:2659 length:672 start_codon:yes stop_codon:yes gene_type:complete